jgi:hypothetical protein
LNATLFFLSSSSFFSSLSTPLPFHMVCLLCYDIT